MLALVAVPAPDVAGVVIAIMQALGEVR